MVKYGVIFHLYARKHGFLCRYHEGEHSISLEMNALKNQLLC